MDAEERKGFVRQHRTAVFGYNRAQHGPSMSIVYYVMDADEILVSTLGARAKALAVARDPRVSLCVLDEKWPSTYIVVYCIGTIETDFESNVDLMMRIVELMAGRKMPEKRESTAAMVRAEQRVTIRLAPYATFETPPRHVYKPEDVDALTHSLGRTLPWD